MHVDVVKNEWLAGFQLVVARLRTEDDSLRVDAQDPWPAFIQRYRDEAADIPPDQFISSLHERMRGDYIFATQPHEEAHCPYHELVVPMRSMAPEPQAV